MHKVRHITLTCLLATLTACAVGPDYRTPDLRLPSQWQAPLPHEGNPARITEWWSQFDDPLLAKLIEYAEHDSPDLAQALARIEQSRASATAARSGLWPALTASAQARRSGGDGVMTQSQRLASASLDASWEIDLFGANRRGSEAAEARLEGAQAAWHNARVSLAAEVAQTYLGLRTCEALLADAERDLDSRRITEQLTLKKSSAGFSSPADDALAQASAAEAANRVLSQRVECDISIKSLVFLTGQAESELRANLQTRRGLLPFPRNLEVEALPANVIAHRPDVAASERAVAAASADIGGAEAARYPRLSLSGTIGPQFLNVDGNKQQGSVWSFGPALDLPIFDAGRRAANADAARVRYAEALAAYRGRVRQAIREVEQSLVRLGSATQQEDEARSAAQGYNKAFQAAEARWQAGLGSQLELEELRRMALAARSTEINVKSASIAAWIGLYRAVGGGWMPSSGQN